MSSKIIYQGYSKRSGKYLEWESTKSEQADKRQLYLMFDAKTLITCLDKNRKVIDKIKLVDIFNEPHITTWDLQEIDRANEEKV